MNMLMLIVFVVTLALVQGESNQYGLKSLGIKPTPELVGGFCCRNHQPECCIKAIQQKVPLNCSLSFLDLLKVSQCIQEAFFEHWAEAVASITDASCCSVFSNNFNDENNICLEQCVQIFQDPGISPWRKLENLQSCMHKNYLFKCFRRCQKFKRGPGAQMEFPFELQCSHAYRMKVGETYVGPRIDNNNQIISEGKETLREREIHGGKTNIISE